MKTLKLVDKYLEEQSASEPPRLYLGYSGLGSPCKLDQWLTFRMAMIKLFLANTLRKFACGHMGEDLMAGRLRMVPGLQLETHDKNGKQYGFKRFGGHFRGHMDGAINGVVEWAEKYGRDDWLVWEHKQVNIKKFEKFIQLVNKCPETALKEWDEVYYGQAVLYVHDSGMPGHYLTVSTPGGRDYYSVITLPDPDKAEKLIKKAEDIIFSAAPPAPKFPDPAYYRAKWLNNYDIIYRDKMPAANGRTCLYSRPTKDGNWFCEYTGKNLTVEEQLSTSEYHLFIPQLIKFAEMVECDARDNWVKYRLPNGKEFFNSQKGGKDHYTSLELVNIAPKLIEDNNVGELKVAFNAKIEHCEYKFD